MRIVVAVLLILLLAWSYAYPRDPQHQYDSSPNHEWVKSLHSPRGDWCCDITDGHAVLDADWDSKDGHYRVRVEGQWVDVPDSAVIAEPNRLGQTIVWLTHVSGVPIVTCFLPGALT